MVEKSMNEAEWERLEGDAMEAPMSQSLGFHARQGGTSSTLLVVYVLASLTLWIGLMMAIQHGLVSVYFLAPGQELYVPIIATFLVGFVVVILEERTNIHKAWAALMLGGLIWTLIGTGMHLRPEEFQKGMTSCLAETSKIVFFLLSVLTIVATMDAYRCFDIITRNVKATKARDLLLTMGVLTFFLSSIMDNLTVVIIMVSLMRQLVKDDDLRLRIGGFLVVASNAGGTWTPMGDITTSVLYFGEQVTAVPLMINLFLPSLACLIGTLSYGYFCIDADATFERSSASTSAGHCECPPGQGLILSIGLIGMVLVPAFTAMTHCPAWAGTLMLLGLLGTCTSILHGMHHMKYSIHVALRSIDLPNTLFFLGVLLAVGGLEQTGLLAKLAVEVHQLWPSDSMVAILLGIASSVIDNVPLVTAAQGMYDLTNHPANSLFWNLITFCCATGGSLLIVGSAAGIAFAGLEHKASFGWYLTTVSPGALFGYALGIAVIFAQHAAGLTIKG